MEGIGQNYRDRIYTNLKNGFDELDKQKEIARLEQEKNKKEEVK